jgi:hypothetical protein
MCPTFDLSCDRRDGNGFFVVYRFCLKGTERYRMYKIEKIQNLKNGLGRPVVGDVRGGIRNRRHKGSSVRDLPEVPRYVLRVKAHYQDFFWVLIDLIVELLVLIIKPFDNQTESSDYLSCRSLSQSEKKNIFFLLFHFETKDRCLVLPPAFAFFLFCCK